MTNVTNLRRRVVARRGQYAELVARSGLSLSWISKFACGVRGRNPTFDALDRLTKALDALDAKERRKPRAKRATGRARGRG